MNKSTQERNITNMPCFLSPLSGAPCKRHWLFALIVPLVLFLAPLHASAQSSPPAKGTPTSPAGPGKGDSSTESRVIESGEGGFRIRLPREFPEFVKQERVIAGTEKTFSAFLTAGPRGAFTVASVKTKPGSAITLEVLKAVRDLELKKTETATEHEETLKIPAAETLQVYSKGPYNGLKRFVRFRVFAVENRVFEVAFICLEKDHRDDADIAAAFDSFQALSETEMKSLPQGPSPPLAFASPEGVFSLELPPGFQKPSDQSEVIQSQITDFKATQFLSTGPAGLILMTHISRIQGMNTRAQIDEIRDSLTTGIVGGLKGRITSSKPSVRDGLSVREIRFSGQTGGQVLNGRALIYGQKGRFLIFILLASSFEALESDDANRFFDSIKVTQ